MKDEHYLLHKWLADLLYLLQVMPSTPQPGSGSRIRRWGDTRVRRARRDSFGAWGQSNIGDMLERFFWVLIVILRYFSATRAHNSHKPANRRIKPTEPTMSAPKTTSSFLDFPPGKKCKTRQYLPVCVLNDISELRNRIYTFAAYYTTDDSCCVAPCIALVSTCRQIYDEYRPICLKAEITINWRDVPRYFQRYYIEDGALAHVDLAPARMTIITNVCLVGGKPVSIDLLPILKLRLANQSFDCEFVISGYEESTGCDCGYGAAAVTRDDLTTLLAADTATLQQLLRHEDEDWVNDIKGGRIQKLVATHIGTNCCPMIKFHVGRGEKGSFSPEFETIAKDAELAQVAADGEQRPVATSHWVHAFSRAFNGYLGRIKLQAAFAENQYGFLSVCIWSTKLAARWENTKANDVTSDAGEDTDSGMSIASAT